MNGRIKKKRREAQQERANLSLGLTIYPVLYTTDLISSSQEYYNVGLSITIVIFFVIDAKVEFK